MKTTLRRLLRAISLYTCRILRHRKHFDSEAAGEVNIMARPHRRSDLKPYNSVISRLRSPEIIPQDRLAESVAVAPRRRSGVCGCRPP